MNLLEALKIGRITSGRIKRKQWIVYHEVGEAIYFATSDVLQDDWEVQGYEELRPWYSEGKEL